MSELESIKVFVAEFGIKGESFDELVILMNDMYLALQEKEKNSKLKVA